MESREIKFRGKCIEKKNNYCGKWIYGYYCKKLGYSEPRIYHYILDDTLGEFIIDPETVGQFTGILDQQGCEVYEGDIVRGLRENALYFGVIEWWKEYVCFGCKCYKSVDYDGTIIEYKKIRAMNYTLGLHLDMLKDLEVIGNVYENPELLVTHSIGNEFEEVKNDK